MLAGPTGVGKSRLAARGPAELGRYGWSTDTVRGTSSARDTPHRALAHLLPAVMPADVINPLRWAVDQMVPAGQRRRALLVDDAHQLDAASAAVVSHLVEKRRATVLASVRTAEPTPDAIASLWRGDRAEQIELGALSVEETAHTVRGALRGVIEPATPGLLAQARTSYSEAAGLRGHYLDSQNAARAALDSIDSWRDAVPVDCRTAAHELDGLRAVGGCLVSAGDGDAALRCALDHAERSIQADTPAMAALHSAVRLGAAAARRTARNWWRSPPSTRHPANPRPPSWPTRSVSTRNASSGSPTSTSTSAYPVAGPPCCAWDWCAALPTGITQRRPGLPHGHLRLDPTAGAAHHDHPLAVRHRHRLRRVTHRQAHRRPFLHCALRWRAFPTPAGAPVGSPTDITIDNNEISKAMGVTPTSDGTFFAQARLIGPNDPAAVARYRAGRIVVREQHSGYKIRTDDKISRTEWLDVVDVVDVPQPRGG